MKKLADHNIIQFVMEASDEVTINDPKMFWDLTGYINELIAHDFERLVSLLYRIDVSEQNIKQMLQEQQGLNAAETIAALIVERQLQKLKSRQENRRDKNDISSEESW